MVELAAFMLVCLLAIPFISLALGLIYLAFALVWGALCWVFDLGG